MNYVVHTYSSQQAEAETASAQRREDARGTTIKQKSDTTAEMLVLHSPYIHSLAVNKDKKATGRKCRGRTPADNMQSILIKLTMRDTRVNEAQEARY